MNADSRSWDLWCERYGIDPNTGDERLFDDFLHGRVPPVLGYRTGRKQAPVMLWEISERFRQLSELQWRDRSQEEVYASWEAYDLAMASASTAERAAHDKAECFELARWYRL